LNPLRAGSLALRIIPLFGSLFGGIIHSKLYRNDLPISNFEILTLTSLAQKANFCPPILCTTAVALAVVVPLFTKRFNRCQSKSDPITR